MNSGISRREFVGASAAGLAVVAASKQAAAATGTAADFTMPTFTKARVLRLFIGTHRAWPKPDLNIDDEIKRLRAGIDAAPGVEDIEFLGNLYIKDTKGLAPVLKQYRDVDGILAVQTCMGTREILKMLADSGIPIMTFHVPYSGHEWYIIPDMQRAGKKIDAILASDLNQVSAAFRQFRAIHRLKETRVLHVGGGRNANPNYVSSFKSRFGTTIVDYDHKQLNEAYNAMDAAAVEAETNRWIKNASRVVEPSREEIAKSARLCLAMQKALADEKAHAITINCLGLFGMKGLPAYPCFGFVRLNDMGLVGVCEADLLSTMTQIVYQHMAGKPGFVTDPTFDVPKNTVIHAHCVSATKMDGPEGESAPYNIRCHLEDYKGAVVQTKMRKGQFITMAKLVGTSPNPKEIPQIAASPSDSENINTMLISTGEIVDIPDSDRGCRTQIAVKVRDARKMFEQWSNGLHRVIFYGDYLADTRRLARFLDLKVVEEC